MYPIKQADGTLSFGIDDKDKDNLLSRDEILHAIVEIRNKTGTFSDVSGKIDENTTIKIKGCDLGNNQEIVELLDESFGGKGTVIAPKSKQRYMPDEPSAGKKEEIYERLQGILVERPGTQPFKEKEFADKINDLYGHLSKKERADIIRKLLKVQKTESIPVYDYTFEYKDINKDLPDDNTLIERAKKDNPIPNPNNYKFEVKREEVKEGDKLKQKSKVYGTRVIAHLPKQSLGKYFYPMENNPRYHAISKFKPPQKPPQMK